MMRPDGRDAVAVTDSSSGNVAQAKRELHTLGVVCEEVTDSAAGDARVLVAGGFTPIDSDVLARLRKLEVVVRTGAGYNNVDLPALSRAGVRLIAPRLDDDSSVAEYVFGGVLSVLRDLPGALAAARTGDWGYRSRFIGSMLRGRTLGIVGMGRIGTQVATLGHCFGMKVLAWHPWSKRRLRSWVTRTATLEDLLERSDVVTLHCRLEPDTRHLINSAALNRMRKGSVLVSTTRGGMVDEEALALALQSGHLGGAVIDVFEGEPDVSRSPLLNQKEAFVTLHLAGITHESNMAISHFVAQTVVDHLAGRALPERYLVV